MIITVFEKEELKWNASEVEGPRAGNTILMLRDALWYIDGASILLIQDMHMVTVSTSLNWLFGVSCMLLMLSSCVWVGGGRGSDSVSRDVISSSV